MNTENQQAEKGDDNIFKSNNITSQRDNFRVSMRREDRLNEIQKRRNLSGFDDTKLDANEIGECKSGGERTWGHLDAVDNRGEMIKMISKYLEMEYDINQLEELSQILLTEINDVEKLHYAFIGLRKLLSLNTNTPIQPVIDLNLPQKLIEYMDCEKYPHLILESTWCCCNISTGTSSQIQRLIDKGLIAKLVKLLYCNSSEIFEQAAWCVANIAADCNKFKDILITNGACKPLSERIIQSNDLKTIKNSTWSLANLCRGKNSMNEELFCASGAFIKVLLTLEDNETISDALMGLSEIMNEAVINTIHASPI